MSRLTRRAVIDPQGGGGGGPTYDDFEAHITGLATDGSVAWGSPLNANGSFRTTAATPSGDMTGTSWSGFYWTNSAPCRIIQHGLPSFSAFNDQVSSSRQVFFRGVTAGTGDPLGLTRNGYQSSQAGEPGTLSLCTLIIYWDGTQAQQMNPSTGTGPTPYTW